MFYSSDAEGPRVFLRDKLGLKATDIKEVGVIFNLPEADMGSHPAHKTDIAPSGTSNISFSCDVYINQLMTPQTKLAIFKGEMEAHVYRQVLFFQAPGDFRYNSIS
jgi:hypothetical protein